MQNLTTINTMSEQEALVVLSSQEKTVELIDTVTKLAKSEILDPSISKDRKRMKSLAAAVSKSKTLVDGHGKKIVEPMKAQAKTIDANRKLLRDSFDALRDEVKQPAIEFDNIERERIENHNAAIQYINSLSDWCDEFGNAYDSSSLKASLEEAVEFPTTEEHCQEFAVDYSKAKAAAISVLKGLIAKAEKQETEAKELEELRQLKAQKEREEYEAKLKAEAAEDARQAEIKRQQDLAEQESNLQVEREANKKHCTKINTTAMNAIVGAGLSKDDAKKVITAIGKGLVPNVSINY